MGFFSKSKPTEEEGYTPPSTGSSDEGPLLRLTQKGSPYTLYFEHASTLSSGASLSLIGPGLHAGKAVVPRQSNPSRHKEWSSIELGLGPRSMAMHVRLEEGFLVRVHDERVFQVAGTNEGNTLSILRSLESHPDNTRQASSRRSFVVNPDGTISPAGAPHLVLGAALPTDTDVKVNFPMRYGRRFENDNVPSKLKARLEARKVELATLGEHDGDAWAAYKCKALSCLGSAFLPVLGWMLYYFDNLHSITSMYVYNVKPADEVEALIARLKAAKPVLVWQINCGYTHTSTDNDGSTYTTWVSSHAATKTFSDFATVVDETLDVRQLLALRTPILAETAARVHFELDCYPMDPVTRQKLCNDARAFYDMNKRDSEQKYSWRWDLETNSGFNFGRTQDGRFDLFRGWDRYCTVLNPSEGEDSMQSWLNHETFKHYVCTFRAYWYHKRFLGNSPMMNVKITKHCSLGVNEQLPQYSIVPTLGADVVEATRQSCPALASTEAIVERPGLARKLSSFLFGEREGDEQIPPEAVSSEEEVVVEGEVVGEPEAGAIVEREYPGEV